MKSLNGFGKTILCKNVPFHNVFNFTCFSDTSLLFFASYTQEKTRLTQPKVSFIILGGYDINSIILHFEHKLQLKITS